MKLTIQNLSKTYPNGTQALKDVNLEITTGMFGLLGPNGAGKSTLMRSIATLQEPDEGSIFLDELDVLKQKKELRQVLGYLPQAFGLYPDLPAEELLDHFATLKGIYDKRERKASVKALLEQTNLYHVRKKKLGTYSGGMKQRFGIAQALLGNPKLIIVDEPTAGLDPSERQRFHNLLSEIGEHIIVILSTHIVEDVSDICSHMAIIHKGEVLLTGVPQEVLKEAHGHIWQAIIDKSEVELFQETYNLISSRLYGGKVIVKAYGNTPPGGAFEAVEPELQDVYFNYIKEREQAEAAATRAS